MKLILIPAADAKNLVMTNKENGPKIQSRLKVKISQEIYCKPVIATQIDMETAVSLSVEEESRLKGKKGKQREDNMT